MAQTLVKLSGQMRFAEKAFTLGPAHVIEGSRQEQRKAAVKNGVSEAQFDHWHRQGQAEASQEWQAMGERDRQEFCRELHYYYHHE